MRKSAATRSGFDPIGAEPAGIVIAGPDRGTEVVPRIVAYEWGPAPELEPEVRAQPRAA